jgi:hypothetical protein
MPIYASKNTNVYRYVSGTWSAVRGASSGTGSDGGDLASYGLSAAYGTGAGAFHTAGRGYDAYRITRSFFYFDFSSESGTVIGADIAIHTKGTPGCDIIFVASDAFGGDGGTAAHLNDYNNFDTSTPYSAEVPVGNLDADDYNIISLNSDALSYINANSRLIICMMEHTYDFSDSAPSGLSASTSIYYTQQSGTDKDPYIRYNVAAAGYGHTVNGVAPANIATVKGVATANIETVIGVD